MNKKLRSMLEQAGTIRHLCNLLLVTNLGSITNEERNQILKHTSWFVEKKNNITIEIPSYEWDDENELFINYGYVGNRMTIEKKKFRKCLVNPLGYLESINQHIRKYCWQELKTEKQKQPELSISNWKEFFIEENATTTDIIELYENWIENKKLILIDESGTDYRENFWNRFGHCFDEKILEVC